MYFSEDKDQALVQTPYGKGLVVRTRSSQQSQQGEPTIREIELLDWTKLESSSQGSKRPHMLYSPLEFPSVTPVVGSEVSTSYGRGKVTEIRHDGQTVVVRVSSWRLAGRSTVTCYLSMDSVQVIRPKKIFEMTAYEKVEHAEQLKKQASSRFSAKDYSEALQLYAEAVDAVRYVQHKKDSTNELRADLLIVMITCCNNAGTCCLQLKEWDRAQKFAKNALVLLEALHEKKGNSNILKLLNREGTSDSKLFGAWMVKSRLVIARGLAERHDADGAIDNLKNALEMISENKKDEDPIFRQLHNQEKEVRKLLASCKDRIKAARKKEKQRARAMFSFADDEKDSEHKDPNDVQSATVEVINAIAMKQESDSSFVVASEATDQKQGTEDGGASKTTSPLKKRVSFADGTTPGSVDDNAEPPFLEEHKEALLLVAGIALGSLCVHLFTRRRL